MSWAAPLFMERPMEIRSSSGDGKGKITAAHVAGGYTGGTHADSNTVSLANAEVTGSIIDGTTVLSTQKTVYGYDDDGDVTSTTPYTSALSFAAEGDQSAKGNTVSLANVSGGLVLGGMVMQGAAKGNTVTISGSTAENVYGGAAGILGTDSASIRSALKSSLPVLEYDEKTMTITALKLIRKWVIFPERLLKI